MKYYNPNMYGGVHRVRVTIQQRGYIGHIFLNVEGNCRGKENLEFDFYDSTGNGESDCKFRAIRGRDYFSVRLTDARGNNLQVEGTPKEFNYMVVAIEIIDYISTKED